MGKLKKTPRSLPQRFHQLFDGWGKAHGVFHPQKQSRQARGKVTGGQATELGPPTPELWEAHLSGAQGLGVYMLRLDGTVRFAAIDVDVYPVDHRALAERISKAELPLILCKSKSGGAHLYLFGQEDLPAALVRQRLATWATMLNILKYELFPHKDVLAGPEDYGKYLNMPYFSGKERCAVSRSGKELPPAAFLTAAHEAAVSIDQLEQFREVIHGDLEGAPPCLQSLLNEGPVGEFRDNTLMSLGVYLRRRYPDEWEQEIEEYHRRFIHPLLSSPDMVKVIRSVGRKDYNYMCSQEPIASYCNSPVCITRQYGIRAGMDDQAPAGSGFNLNLGGLSKFTSDPPTWELEVNGEVLRLSTDQLMNYPMFRKAVLEARNVFPAPLKADTWHKIVEDKLNNDLEIVQAPAEAGVSGQLRWHLERFCTYLKARNRTELKDGRPWWHEGRVYLRAPHFIEYLQKHRCYIEPHELTSQFRRWGFTHGQFKISSLNVQWWSLPEFEVQSEPDEVPRPANEGVRF